MLCILRIQEHNSTHIFYLVSFRTNNLCYFIGTLPVWAYHSNILLSGALKYFSKDQVPAVQILLNSQAHKSIVE